MQGRAQCIRFSQRLAFSKSSHIRTYFSDSQAAMILTLNILRLISRYKGSYSKDSLHRPFQESSLRTFDPVLCFGKATMGLKTKAPFTRDRIQMDPYPKCNG